MRKITSGVIGAFVAGSRTPTVSNTATLPWRATRRIAPGMTPFSASARSIAVILLSRPADRPTCSGLALGRLCAWATTTVTRQSATASEAIRVLIGLSSSEAPDEPPSGPDVGRRHYGREGSHCKSKNPVAPTPRGRLLAPRPARAGTPAARRTLTPPAPGNALAGRRGGADRQVSALRHQPLPVGGREPVVEGHHRRRRVLPDRGVDRLAQPVGTGRDRLVGRRDAVDRDQLEVRAVPPRELGGLQEH